jgi:hypothetical protein
MLFIVILTAIVFLTGCCCPTCPSSFSQNCSLTITAGYWVWGTIYINGQSTNQDIDFSISSIKTVTVNVPCNQQISVIIVDPCGLQSHIEYVYTNPGYNNTLYFAYW